MLDSDCHFHGIISGMFSKDFLKRLARQALLALPWVLFMLFAVSIGVMTTEDGGTVARLLGVDDQNEPRDKAVWLIFSGMGGVTALIVLFAYLDDSNTLKTNLSSMISVVILALLAICLFLFLWVLLEFKFIRFESCKVMQIIETSTKIETLQFIGWGMGGLVAMLGMTALNRRAAAMDKQNDLTEKGHIEERFKTASQGLGSEKAAVRFAAFYQFYYLAKDNPNKDFRKNILDVLCAHLRHATNERARQRPTEEFQSLLDILFKTPQNVFANMGASLRGASLRGMNLKGADLVGVDFQHANLTGANLQKADCRGAELRHAKLAKAELQGADFSSAKNIDQARFLLTKYDAATKFPGGKPPKYFRGKRCTVAEEK